MGDRTEATGRRIEEGRKRKFEIETGKATEIH